MTGLKEACKAEQLSTPSQGQQTPLVAAYRCGEWETFVRRRRADRHNASMLMQTSNFDEDDGKRDPLTDLQLAARRGISPKILRNSRLKGSAVPYIRIGRLVRYRLADIVAYEEGRLVSSTSHEGRRQ